MKWTENKADKEKGDKEKADKEKGDKEKADKEKADKEKADKEKGDIYWNLHSLEVFLSLKYPMSSNALYNLKKAKLKIYFTIRNKN